MFFGELMPEPTYLLIIRPNSFSNVNWMKFVFNFSAV